MDWLWTTLGLIAIWLGVILTPFGLPGTFLIALAAALLGWHSAWSAIAPWLVGVLFLLALLGEAAEQWLSLAGARRYGGTRWGMWGAFLGGFGGAFVGVPIFLVGSLVGALLGALVGAMLAEGIAQRSLPAALRAGYGAFLGKAGAVALKTALATAMALSATWALWSPWI